MVARDPRRDAARRRGDLAAAVRHAGHAGDGVRRRRAAARVPGCSARSTSRRRARPCGRWPRRRSRSCCSATPRASTSRELRREAGVPVRLLGIGLPLTIALGAVAGALVLDQLTIQEAVILAVVLAPTDAALGQAVVTEPRVPGRVRQGLNVESGLNDGICVPLLFAAVAIADVESGISDGRNAVTLLLEEIGYGVLGGVVGGALVAVVLVQAGRRGLIADPWRRVVPAAGAALAYGVGGRARGLGVHRRVRRGHHVPVPDRPRSRGRQRPERAGGRRPRRRDLRPVRGDPPRAGARRALLGARGLRGAQPDAGPDAPGRRSPCSGRGRGRRRSASWAGSVPAGSRRSCSP